MSTSPSSSRDLIVVGPGVLGGYLGKLWKDAYPEARVVGLTNTTNNHDRLRNLGLTPALKSDLLPGQKFPFAVFSAPPSGSQDYPAEVKAALSLWDAEAEGGSFLFTSSLSVCSEEDGGLVTDQDCPLVPLGKGPSTDRLLLAEEAVLKGGGNVLRLVGLYHGQRGAHNYFLKVKDVPRWGGYTVNLIHYEDASRLSMSIIRGDGNGPFKGRIFLGCDNHPITFQAMVDACHHSGLPGLQGEVNWTLPQAQSTLGKKVDNSGTREVLGGWEPKFDGFEAFLAAGGTDFYTATGWI